MGLQAEHLDQAPALVIKGGMDGSQMAAWCFQAQKAFQQLPSHLQMLQDLYMDLLPVQPKCPLNHCIVFPCCAPGQASLCGTSQDPSGLQGSVLAGVSSVVSLALLHVPVQSLSCWLCRSCWVSSQFFVRGNRSGCRCKCEVFLEKEVSSASSHTAILDQKLPVQWLDKPFIDRPTSTTWQKTFCALSISIVIFSFHQVLGDGIQLCSLKKYNPSLRMVFHFFLN